MFCLYLHLAYLKVLSTVKLNDPYVAAEYHRFRTVPCAVLVKTALVDVDSTRRMSCSQHRRSLNYKPSCTAVSCSPTVAVHTWHISHKFN